GGGVDQLWRQVVGAVAVLVFSGVLTAIIGFAIKATIGWRIPDEDEVSGIDQAQHAESGYDLVGSFGGHSPSAAAAAASTTRTSEGASA
ncbi:ammonium transporter, partial [Streptomyces sp. NP160]